MLDTADGEFRCVEAGLAVDDVAIVLRSGQNPGQPVLGADGGHLGEALGPGGGVGPAKELEHFVLFAFARHQAGAGSQRCTADVRQRNNESRVLSI